MNCVFRTAARLLFISAVPPVITGAGEVTLIQAPMNTSITLICQTTGVPTPNIQWFKDEQALQAGDAQDQYILPYLQQTDEGLYRCVGTNKAGSAHRLFNVTVYRERTLFRALC